MSYKKGSRPAQSINEREYRFSISENLEVTVLPNAEHEFLMTTNEVAKGYDVARQTVSWHISQNQSEIKEGVHYVKGASITDTLSNIQPHQTFWTKAGIIRLGFFIKSERAVMFRDWAEHVILEKLTAPAPVKSLPPTPRRKHNRLTPERVLRIMSLVCRIEDNELRISIANELTQGGSHA
jgi:hypothetical protein